MPCEIGPCGTVDSTLTVWGDVSKKWSMLESVFVGSADIRVQLPDDSKRFDMINADFQVGCCMFTPGSPMLTPC